MAKTIFIFAIFTLIHVTIASNPEEGDLFEGDMELDPDQMAALNEQLTKGNSFASVKSNLWKYSSGRPRTIKYFIDDGLYKEKKARYAIYDAIKDYEKYTCLKFQEYDTQPSGSHLVFTTGTGCSSPVGRRSNGNYIKLASGCWRKGIVIHEIGHSIGFHHEQSRPDRDSHVEIIWDNIRVGKDGNFRKYNYDKIDSLGTKYDYDSVMHYRGTSFGDGKMTIRTLDRSKQDEIGQRDGFSYGDKKQINKLYCENNSAFQ